MGRSNGRAMVTVVIIHNDLGVTFWLGQILTEAGYAALPAKAVSEAVDLIAEHKIEADLLIINSSLPGVVDLIANLRRSRPGLKVIAAVDVEGQSFSLPGVDCHIVKPVCADEGLRLKWLKTIQELLTQDSAAQ